MAAYFLGSLLTLFYLQAGDGLHVGRQALPAVLTVEEGEANSLAWIALIVLFLAGMVALCWKIYTWRRRYNRRMRMTGHNHPAIPAIVYETPRRQDPPEASKQAEPEPAQQEAPPDPPPPAEQEKEPDDYHFYTQLDSLEED